MSEERNVCLDNGLDAHLSKPIGKDALFAILRACARS